MQVKIQMKESLSGFVSKNFAAKFAKMQADKINVCASAAKDSMEQTIERNIDRPTPFTGRAIYRTYAAKGKPYAAVGIKDMQAAYLAPLIKGGTVRQTKPVPTPYTANQFGNLPRNASKQWKRAKGIAAYKSKRGNVVYVQRVGNALYILATWSKSRTYKQRLGLIIRDAAKAARKTLR
jgi:hypothetical protein